MFLISNHICPNKVENPKGRSRQKIGEKTMGMAKILTRTSWEKVTWHRKKKRKMKKRKIKTISKDNKMVDTFITQIKR